MFYISHRGNTNGRVVKEENSPQLIDHALSLGYDVEIDVWHYKNSFYLGHDEPQYQVQDEFLFNDLFNQRFWCHAKNIKALEQLLHMGAHCFWHEDDKVTLTSKGYIWTYPGNELSSRSVCVMPEVSMQNTANCLGICSDYIKLYKDK